MNGLGHQELATNCKHESVTLKPGTNLNANCLYGSAQLIFGTCNDCGQKVRIEKPIANTEESCRQLK